MYGDIPQLVLEVFFNVEKNARMGGARIIRLHVYVEGKKKKKKVAYTLHI